MSALNRFLIAAEKRALSGQEIVHFLNGDVTIVHYELLNTVYDIKQLFTTSNRVVLLLPVESRKQGHWISIIYFPSENFISIYDSYGMTLEQDIIASSYLIHHQSRKQQLALPHLLERFDGRYEVNRERVQQLEDGINTCGRHAIIRLHHSHMKNSEYTQYIRGKVDKCKLNTDMLVTLMMYLYL